MFSVWGGKVGCGFGCQNKLSRLSRSKHMLCILSSFKLWKQILLHENVSAFTPLKLYHTTKCHINSDYHNKVELLLLWIAKLAWSKNDTLETTVHPAYWCWVKETSCNLLEQVFVYMQLSGNDVWVSAFNSKCCCKQTPVRFNTTTRWCYSISPGK